jgi:hypothetical protein
MAGSAGRIVGEIFPHFSAFLAALVGDQQTYCRLERTLFLVDWFVWDARLSGTA